MAINVNTVYTTVLSILNKEQRGYLTPYEFNQLATQVQLEIFENFFEDYNQYIRMPKTDVEFASRMDHIREEFQVFEKNGPASAVTTNVYTQPTDLHRFGSAFYEIGKNNPELEIVSKRDYHQQKLSPLTQPTTNFPIATYHQDKLTVYPASSNTPLVGDIGFNYIRKPANVVWAYGVDATTGAFIWDGTPGFVLTPIIGGASVNFEISDSQQTEVIIDILKYAGVIIRDPQIVQSASQLSAANEANTKR
tara:strand:+ start:1694 stop:2443 length:750 start_codon:yes stop_codon:yes gene_type:complete